MITNNRLKPPENELLEKLIEKGICSKEGKITKKETLPPLQGEEAQKIQNWLHKNFFVEKEQFKPPLPISIYTSLIYAAHEMKTLHNLTQEKIVLNGSAVPFFLPKSYLFKIFYKLGLENPEELLTDEVLTRLANEPNDFDLKIKSPLLSQDQLKQMSGFLDRYLAKINDLTPEEVNRQAYLKKKIVLINKNQFFVLGLKGSFQFDLVVAKSLEREYLFEHDSLNIRLDPYLFSKDSFLVEAKETNGVQALIYKLTKILRIEEVESANEFAFARVISYFSQGWRTFQEKEIEALYKKTKSHDLKTILEITAKSHHKSPDELFSFFFNALIFSKEEDHKVIQETFKNKIPQLSSLLGQKIKELLSIRFPILQKTLFLKCFLQDKLGTPLNDYKTHLTENQNKQTLHLFLTDKAVLCLPKPIKTDLVATQEEVEELKKLDVYFPSLTIDNLKNKNNLNEIKSLIELKEKDLYPLILDLLDSLNTPQIEKTDTLIRSFFEELIDQSDQLQNQKIFDLLTGKKLPLILKNSDLIKLLTVLLYSDLKIALQKEDKKLSINCCCRTPLTLRYLEPKSFLFKEIFNLSIKTALISFKKTFEVDIKEAGADTKMQYLNQKNIILNFESHLLTLLKTKHKSLETITVFSAIYKPEIVKNQALIEDINEIHKILIDEGRKNSLHQQLILYMLMEQLKGIALQTTLRNPLLESLFVDFIFIPVNNSFFDKAISYHVELSLDLFKVFHEKGLLSKSNLYKITLFITLQQNDWVKEDKEKMRLFEELVTLLPKYDSPLLINRLLIILPDMNPLFKKYPQKTLTLFKQIMTTFEEKYAIDSIYENSITKLLMEYFLSDSRSFGPFLYSAKSEEPFIKDFFKFLFDSYARIYTKGKEIKFLEIVSKIQLESTNHSFLKEDSYFKTTLKKIKKTG
jgi:hypothetical protein